jgi:putative SOS response-associated peptidase YedK
MCGRYAFVASSDLISKQFNAKVELEQLRMITRSYNIAPTHRVCVINSGADGKVARVMRWGLIPNWIRDLSQFKATTFNARSETITESKMYAMPFKKQRCLVLASGYYEWRDEGGKKKQPYYFTTTDGGTMAFAGIYDIAHIDMGDHEDTMETCSIITCEPNEVTAEYHDRMPVIIEPKNYDAWLDPQTPEAQLREMLKPCKPDFLEIFQVDKGVSNVNNESQIFIEIASVQETLL